MFPAEIDNIGALAIKRAQASEVTFIQGEPLVDDICLVLINEGEEVPEGYVSLERLLPQKESIRGSKTSQGLTKTVIAYHQRPAMGLCDLSYESATLDRYPQKVSNSFFFTICNFISMLNSSSSSNIPLDFLFSTMKLSFVKPLPCQQSTYLKFSSYLRFSVFCL